MQNSQSENSEHWLHLKVRATIFLKCWLWYRYETSIQDDGIMLWKNWEKTSLFGVYTIKSYHNEAIRVTWFYVWHWETKT